MSDLKTLILSSDDIKSDEIVVPEWGNVKLGIRGMTAEKRAELMSMAMDPVSGDTNFEVIYPLVIVYTVFDPETQALIFDPADVAALNQKAAAVVERIATKSMEISGLTKASQEAMGKDSSSSESVDFSSSLPSDLEE